MVCEYNWPGERVMSTNHPKVLNVEFLTKCLQSGEAESTSTQVISFESKPGLTEDLNFASILLRVRILYKKDEEEDAREISLIVKLPPENDCLKFAEIIARKEHTFYSNIVPYISKICGENLFPKSFPSPVPTVVVLEDLSCSGYKTASRVDLLDFDHCKLYFQAAAKMHAASIVMVEKDSKIIDSFGHRGNWMMNQDPDLKKKFTSISSIGVKCLADLVRHIDEYRDILKVLDDVAEDVWDLVVAAEMAEGSLKCLIQFDSYKANMMFKYDDVGKVEAIKLLDFQTYSYFPAVIDIINFIWRSADDEVREKHLDELYQYYCDNLNHNLSGFGSSESITLQKLEDQLNVFSPLVLYLVCFYLPYGQAENPVDLNKLFDYSIEDPQKCYESMNEMMRQSPKIFPSILKHLRKQRVIENLKKLSM